MKTLSHGWQIPRRRGTRRCGLAIKLHPDRLRWSEAGEMESWLEECLDAEVED